MAETVTPTIDVRPARTIAGALKQSEDGLLEAFVLDRAEEQGWLKAINELNTRFSLNGMLRVDIDEAARQYFAQGFWCQYPGTNGIHIFGPPKPPA